jgi:hypothetical protein
MSRRTTNTAILPHTWPVGHEVAVNRFGQIVRYVGAHVVGRDGLPVHPLLPGRRFLPQAGHQSRGPAFRTCPVCVVLTSRG